MGHLRFPGICGSFSKAFIFQSISFPSLSSQAFWFVYYLPQLFAPCSRAAGTNAFVFMCFQQMPPSVAVSVLGEFQINPNKGNTFELALQRANQTGQNKQAQFFKNKSHSTFSGRRNLYPECRLLSSRLPLSKGVGNWGGQCKLKHHKTHLQ